MTGLTRFLTLLLVLPLAVLPALGCGGDDDDDSGDDDDDLWQGAPEIETDGEDVFGDFSDDVLELLELAPRWMMRDLTESLSGLSGDFADMWAQTVLGMEDRRLVDEVAFVVAHMAYRDLIQVEPQLLVDNAASIYAAGEVLPYATVIDEGEPGVDEDYYTTVELELPDGPVTVERDVYYWYIVHPRLEDERPMYIDPESGGEALPPTGVFWRDFLLNYADDGCPGKAECPLLADMLAEETTAWNYLNDAQDNGAIGAITRWVNVSMDFDSGSFRPIQPVSIYLLHMGRCGEHADLTSAAGRAALIPTVNVAAYADDHTWNEFYDGAWHEWEPVNDYVDEFEHYDNWGGGGAGLHAVYASRGDGYITPRTADYTETCTMEVTVTDEAGNPVEGACVTNAGLIYGRYNENYQGFTGPDGTLTFQLGDEGQFPYMAVTSPVGDYPDGDPERVVNGTQTGGTYTWDVALSGEVTPVDVSDADPQDGAGMYEITVDYDFPTRFLHGTSILASLALVDGSLPGTAEVMILDRANLDLYRAGDPFEAAAHAVAGTGSLSLDLPDAGPWYVVVSNAAASSSVQMGEVTVSVAAQDQSVTAPDPVMMTLRIEPGDDVLFALHGF